MKKSLNIDSIQFQQDEQSPLTSTIEHKKKTITYENGNLSSGFGQAQTY